MRRKQVQAQQGGVKGSIERRWPRIRVFPGGERGSSPFEGGATFEEFFAGSVGRGRDAGVGKELQLLCLSRDEDFWLRGFAKLVERMSGRCHSAVCSYEVLRGESERRFWKFWRRNSSTDRGDK